MVSWVWSVRSSYLAMVPESHFFAVAFLAERPEPEIVSIHFSSFPGLLRTCVPSCLAIDLGSVLWWIRGPSLTYYVHIITLQNIPQPGLLPSELSNLSYKLPPATVSVTALVMHFGWIHYMCIYWLESPSYKRTRATLKCFICLFFLLVDREMLAGNCCTCDTSTMTMCCNKHSLTSRARCAFG